MSLYIRVQRDTKTWFLHVDPEDEVRVMKVELARIEDRNIDDIRLISEHDAILNDHDTVTASKLSNSSPVFLVYRTEGDEFEKPSVKKVQYQTDREPTLPPKLVQYLDDMNPSEQNRAHS